MSSSTTSEDFIAWSIEKLKDQEYFDYIVGEIQLLQKDYYSIQRRKHFLRDLKAKLERASATYPTPILSELKTEKEIKEELLDLVGWNLILEFNRERTGSV